MTIDDAARAVTLFAGVGLVVFCAWALVKRRDLWRVILPVAFWAATLAAFSVTSLFVTPRPTLLLNWWSRLMHLYSAFLMTLMLAMQIAVHSGAAQSGAAQSGVGDGGEPQ
jgi:hypothetical protein